VPHVSQPRGGRAARERRTLVQRQRGAHGAAETDNKRPIGPFKTALMEGRVAGRGGRVY